MFAAIAAACVFMLVLDFLWIACMRHVYAGVVKQIQGFVRFKPFPGAIIAYLAMVVGLYKFVLSFATTNAQKFVLNAVAFGFVVYGIYNGTSMVLYAGYPLAIAVMDTLWGMSLFALTASFFLLVKKPGDDRTS